MALRLYLSPTEQVGGFQNVPRVSQVYNSSMGAPSLNQNYANNGGVWEGCWMPGLGATLPVFPFTMTKPTGAATIISRNESQALNSNPAGGTTGYHRLATPACIGAMQIDAALTVDPTQWIPLNSATEGQWAWQFRTENYLGGCTYEAKLNLIPGMAYIWRPSTGLMVGVLWDAFSQNEITSAGCWGVASNYYYSYADWSANWIWTHAQFDCWRGAYQVGPFWASGAVTKFASVAVEAGDVMCIEYWFFSSRTNSANKGSGNRFSMSIGGGTDTTLDNTRDQAAPDYEATPTHNTFIDLPILTPATFPISTPAAVYGPPPSLINVDPGTGPRISLTFDNPVGVIGPTIGPASSGVAVTSVTAIDDTHIDLNLAIAPTEVLSGAARDPNCGAVPDPVPCPVNTWPPEGA